MIVRRSLFTLAAAALAASAAPALEPIKLPSLKPTKAVAQPAEAAAPASDAGANQKLAEAVAARLAGTTVTEGADVSLVTDSGSVTVTGQCQSAAQKKAILEEIRVVSGVKLVKDGLAVGGVRQVQGFGPIAAQTPSAMPPSAMPSAGPAMPGAPGYSGPIGEPMPLGNGSMSQDGAAPPLPGYAWPTYAPYNNVSRVAYPQSYPYNAFPFIGPFYPFPKVPLGWRSVNLTWDDGHWYYGKTATPHDYWRVRFW